MFAFLEVDTTSKPMTTIIAIMTTTPKINPDESDCPESGGEVVDGGRFSAAEYQFGIRQF